MSASIINGAIRNIAEGASHHAVAIGAMGGITAGVAILITSLGMCTTELKEQVASGETLVFEGKLAQASDVVNGVLVDGPRCGCAYVLKADISRMLMAQAEARGDLVAADAARTDCYAAARYARKWGENSPRLTALTNACKPKYA